MLDFSMIPAIDNHCHLPLHEAPPRTVGELARFFTEATDKRVVIEHTPHSLFFRRAIRDLAALLDLDVPPTADFDANSILARRAEYSAHAWFRLVVEKANLTLILADTGYPRSGAWSVAESEEVLNVLPRSVAVRSILRLERVLEDLIFSSSSFADCEEAFRLTIRAARDKGAVGLKSILAYRTGLDIAPDQTSSALASAAFVRLKAETEYTGTFARVADKALLDYLTPIALEEAARIELPVQFHCGFGDTDADLIKSNPALLRPLLENKTLYGAPVVLLHCHPYVKEASYLASVYPQVYLDFSLASPLVAFGGGRTLEDALGLAPTTKILYGSDAWGVPDIIYLGVLHTRQRLSQLLSEWVTQGWLNEREAYTVAEDVLANNARRLYGL